ncbi:hypothetical protein DOY81_001181 [Sarcophaga bullata]|nr:hypothetical protein DOY81_001181 [Sarcophaga bullata]
MSQPQHNKHLLAVFISPLFLSSFPYVLYAVQLNCVEFDHLLTIKNDGSNNNNSNNNYNRTKHG